MTTVGMIGTGTMGGAMVGRLLAAGHDVVIHDARREAAAQLEERGARWAANPTEVADRCRLVLSSLPGPAAVEVVAELLLAGARRGDVHAGLSTVSVACAQRVAGRSASRGVRYLDAPVSGGVTGVRSGTLAVLASGDREALAAATPVLQAFAARIFDLGPDPGAGTLAKLVNNAIFLCSGLVHQEAVVLATRSGIDPSTLDGVLAASSASLYLGLGGLTLSRQWDDPFFTLALAEKDIALALESARSLAVPMPVITAAHQHYLRAVAHGLGDKVCLATLAAVEEAAGVKVPARPNKQEESMTSPARQAAEHYVAKVNAADLEGLVALFAPNATLLHRAGRFEGHDAIRGFYADNVLRHSARIAVLSWVDADRTCVFEMDASSPHGDGVSHAIDHVTVGRDGRIERLAVYHR